jgi:hypothetical protein
MVLDEPAIVLVRREIEDESLVKRKYETRVDLL